MDYLKFQKMFPTELAAIEFFISKRYKQGVFCPFCGSVDKVYHKKARPKNFNCRNCDKDFSVFRETIFENSDTDLRKWLHAMNRMAHVGRKGVSALQLKREIGVTYKTAWRMLHLIRLMMGDTEASNVFEALVEIDETYIGGKPRKTNKHSKDDDPTPPTPNKRGRGTKKTPVVGVVERSSKRVVARVMLPNKEGKKLTGKQLFKVLDAVCRKDTKVMTDQFTGYNILDRKNPKNFIRLKVDHSRAYVDGLIHTNSIESFWALLKRGLYGIYHHVSVKYMQNYVNEFVFRMNNRDAGAFETLASQCMQTNLLNTDLWFGNPDIVQ